MQRLTTEQKAQAYNRLLSQFQRLQEQIRLIQAENIEVSVQDQKKIDQMRMEMKRLDNGNQKIISLKLLNFAIPKDIYVNVIKTKMTNITKILLNRLTRINLSFSENKLFNPLLNRGFFLIWM
jgi:hypothetical protein